MWQLHLLLALFVIGGTSAAPEDIYLEEGGYKGILLAIHPSVKYNPSILSNIRSIFVSAAQSLYEATEYDNNISGKPEEGLTSGKYFSDITILLPKTWPRVEECTPSKTELYENADFRVEPDKQQWGKLMKTVMVNSECREPGLYTLVPESYVVNTTEAMEIYGENLGKAIVHEWGHLRYGLHDESNEKQGGDSCQVMQDWNTYRYRQPIRCSRAITGFRRVDPDDDMKCVFIPEPDTPAVKAQASIMYFKLPFYRSVYTFCDSNYTLDGQPVSPVDEVLHDEYANHNQNHICARKSAWQVLRDHADFDPDNAGPLVPDFDSALNMKCVQQPSKLRIVLVLDISGSMNDFGRLEEMLSNVALFLQSMRYGRADIGINQFSTSATKLIDMTPLDSDENLQRLLNVLPKTAAGWTCIGCGIQLALNMLEEGAGNTAAGGSIMVFTDGEETLNQGLHPTINETRPQVIAKQAIVNGLLLSGVTDQHDLITLSTQSGGKYCIFEDSGDGGIDYYQCLTDIVDGTTLSAIEVKSQDFLLGRGESDNGDVVIDRSFNDDLRFTLSWKPPAVLRIVKGINENRIRKDTKSTDCDNWRVVLTSPDGSTITAGDERYVKQDEYFLITIDASGYQTGEWSYTVGNDNNRNIHCPSRMRIEGFPDTTSSKDEDQPILLSATTSKKIVHVKKDANPMDNVVSIYATLSQGLSPILQANVQAEVEAGNTKWTVDLYDNGAGADLEAGDGIYSRYFCNYERNGVYSVRVAAYGENGRVQILRETRELYEEKDSKGFKVVKFKETIPYERFERNSLGGAFDVSGASGNMDALFPPSRVTNLMVEGRVTEEKIMLTWTAPGQSMDEGTAKYYQLHMCQSSAQLRDNFTACYALIEEDLVQNTTLMEPQSAGSVEHVIINPTTVLNRWSTNSTDGNIEPILNGTYFIAIKAVDAYNNEAAVSNLVSVFFEDPNYTGHESTNTVAIVLGTLAGICILAGAIFGGLYFYRRQQTSSSSAL